MILIAIIWTVVFFQGVQQFFIEFPKTGPFLQPALICLDGIPALECIDWSPQVGVNCKPDDVVLSPLPSHC